uniref:ARAD1D04488p n=1 Tax=Blastobotrys adeninivorans TaxID=409370 RepID=A0A060TE27_BLAAD
MARTTTMPRPGRRRGAPSSAALTLKYRGLEQRLNKEYEEQYAQQTAAIRRRIDQIRSGQDAEFLECLQDLEEQRDYELVTLKLWRDSVVDKMTRDHQATVSSIVEAHTTASKATHERLVSRMEAHVRKMKDDKSLADISSDANLDQLASVGVITNGDEVFGDARVGNGSDKGGYGSGAPGGAGTGSGAGPGGGGRRGRREAANIASYNTAGSGSDSTSDMPTGRTTRQLALVSDRDLDGTSIAGGRNKQPSKYLTSLKTDEINEDLGILRRAK